MTRHRHPSRRRPAAAIAVACLAACAAPAAEPEPEPVGPRPYELEWAKRTIDDHVPLVDFEDLAGWTVTGQQAVATFVRSREQQIWDAHVGQLTYRATGAAGEVCLRPPAPIPITNAFDAVTLWVYGNNWGFAPDPSTPPVYLHVLIEDAAGQEFSVPLRSVNWKEWFLLHRRLTAAQAERVEGGARCTGLLVTGVKNAEDRTLWFDNLAFFTEVLAPMAFEPRPARGIPMFEGQLSHTNFTAEKLPFPNRAETILPPNAVAESKTAVAQETNTVVGSKTPVAPATNTVAASETPVPQATNVTAGPAIAAAPATNATAAGATVPAAETNEVAESKATLPREAITWRLCYEGADGRLEYRYTPLTGRWNDLEAVWQPAFSATNKSARKRAAPVPVRFQPCEDGGVWLQTPGGLTAPEAAELLDITGAADGVHAHWRLCAGAVTTEVKYAFRIWNKSLVIDVAAPGGAVGEVRFGRAVGLDRPRFVPIPYYRLQGGHNCAVVSGPPETPLFLMGHADWYLSNASALWASSGLVVDAAAYNGGTRYTPRTDGRRNDCFERFFISVAPRLEEVLPVIPNPESPWKQVAGTRVWRAHGASDRARDAQYWTDMHRHGLTQLVVTDHETGWRDGGESFTFRTRPAPGKGGDEGQLAYARLMQDQLGFVYGPYNNFTDFAPVNEYWSSDLISRLPDNQLQHAWMRCYAPKPARAVEFAAKLPPVIEKKFQFSTAYCDVHTAVAPWDRVDYDARVPDAGTFAAVFYAYGEIMLLQKQAWGGPVYSEGGYHAYFSGLTDGNYAQDQAYRFDDNPWLVDFDLRRMHDLGCNFGMGNPEMFYANRRPMPADPAERDAWLDRFLAATVAFGHPGFLVAEGGMETAMRSYYMLQQLHSRYCLTNAVEILYADESGRLAESTAAMASGACRLSQVVTRYADGTITAVNGHPSRRMVVNAFKRKLDLPPNGYAGWTAAGAINVISSDRDGRRADYADTPAYVYVDGRGRFTRFAKAASAGIGVCRRLGDGKFEVIPFRNSEFGFAVQVTSVVALAQDGREIGQGVARAARGLSYLLPVKDAFSYRITGGEKMKRGVLVCERAEVTPGEEVTVRGRIPHTFRVPADATPGQRLWHEFESEWIDFTVVPPAEVTWRLDEPGRLCAEIVNHLASAATGTVTLAGGAQAIELAPGGTNTVAAELASPSAETVDTVEMDLQVAGQQVRAKTNVRTTHRAETLVPLPAWSGGMAPRGQAEQKGFGESGGHAHAGATECGGVKREGIAMHPPYRGVTGYTFAAFAPVALPTHPPAAFRAWVGKGDGSDPGDGILYRAILAAEDGPETVCAEATVTNHTWTPVEADLTTWTGRTVRLKLVADVGAADNPNGDWACWGEPRIETLQPVFRRRLEPPPRP